MAGRQLLLRGHRLLYGAAFRRGYGRSDDRLLSAPRSLARANERATRGAPGRGRDGALSPVARAQAAGVPGGAERMTRILFLPGTGASPDFWKPVGAHLPKAW